MSTTIVVDTQTSDVDESLEKICGNCGHALWEHAYYRSYFYPDTKHDTLYVSQCVVCGIEDGKFICENFDEKD